MLNENVSINNNSLSQWVKSPKSSLKQCVFINSALKIQCHVSTLRKFDKFKQVLNSSQNLLKKTM